MDHEATVVRQQIVVIDQSLDEIELQQATSVKRGLRAFSLAQAGLKIQQEERERRREHLLRERSALVEQLKALMGDE